MKNTTGTTGESVFYTQLGKNENITAGHIPILSSNNNSNLGHRNTIYTINNESVHMTTLRSIIQINANASVINGTPVNNIDSQRETIMMPDDEIENQSIDDVVEIESTTMPTNYSEFEELEVRNDDGSWFNVDGQNWASEFNAPEAREVEEAADYGLRMMNELIRVKEPALYRMGLILERDDPASKIASFNAPNPQAVRLARYGYASLQASTRLAQQLSTDDTKLEARTSPLQLPPELRDSLRGTDLHNECPFRGQVPCRPAARRYRTSDGTCNNHENPKRGSALTPQQRFLPPHYDDGLQTIRRSIVNGSPLPSARDVSTRIHRDRHVETPSVTLMLMQWGQFIDHDITATPQSRAFNGSTPRCCANGGQAFQQREFMHPDCLPIPVPNDDWFLSRFNIKCLEFVRSAPAPREECDFGHRQQLNQVTSYIDASTIYGSSALQSDSMRVFRSGLLQYGRLDNRNPPDPPGGELCRLGAVTSQCFRAGDGRVSEQPALTAMHITWIRKHNALATRLAELNPHWSDEKTYQETRRIIGAMIQHITYREFLPIILGHEVMKLFDLDLVPKGYYTSYNPRINPSPANSFTAAAYRFGHSLVQNSFMRTDRFHRPLFNNVSLHDEQSNPANIWSFGSLDRLLLGLSSQPSQRRDEFISEELTNHLFQSPGFPFGMDLAAINIQRGRDHGIPPYTAWRKPCGLSAIKNWTDLQRVMSSETVERFRSLYLSVDDIDLYSAGLAERPVRGGLVGPTFACIIAQQFSNLKRGDRFWYENGDFESSFTPAQLQQIRKTTFASIICATMSEVDTIQPFVFLVADNALNERVICRNLIDFDFTPWIEKFTDIDGNDNFESIHNNDVKKRTVPIDNIEQNRQTDQNFDKTQTENNKTDELDMNLLKRNKRDVHVKHSFKKLSKDTQLNQLNHRLKQLHRIHMFNNKRVNNNSGLKQDRLQSGFRDRFIYTDRSTLTNKLHPYNVDINRQDLRKISDLNKNTHDLQKIDDFKAKKNPHINISEELKLTRRITTYFTDIKSKEDDKTKSKLTEFTPDFKTDLNNHNKVRNKHGPNSTRQLTNQNTNNKIIELIKRLNTNKYSRNRLKRDLNLNNTDLDSSNSENKLYTSEIINNSKKTDSENKVDLNINNKEYIVRRLDLITNSDDQEIDNNTSKSILNKTYLITDSETNTDLKINNKVYTISRPNFSSKILSNSDRNDQPIDKNRTQFTYQTNLNQTEYKIQSNLVPDDKTDLIISTDSDTNNKEHKTDLDINNMEYRPEPTVTTDLNPNSEEVDEPTNNNNIELDLTINQSDLNRTGRKRKRPNTRRKAKPKPNKNKATTTPVTTSLFLADHTTLRTIKLNKTRTAAKQTYVQTNQFTVDRNPHQPNYYQPYNPFNLLSSYYDDIMENVPTRRPTENPVTYLFNTVQKTTTTPKPDYQLNIQINYFYNTTTERNNYQRPTRPTAYRPDNNRPMHDYHVQTSRPSNFNPNTYEYKPTSGYNYHSTNNKIDFTHNPYTTKRPYQTATSNPITIIDIKQQPTYLRPQTAQTHRPTIHIVNSNDNSYSMSNFYNKQPNYDQYYQNRPNQDLRPSQTIIYKRPVTGQITKLDTKPFSVYEQSDRFYETKYDDAPESKPTIFINQKHDTTYANLNDKLDFSSGNKRYVKVSTTKINRVTTPRPVDDRQFIKISTVKGQTTSTNSFNPVFVTVQKKDTEDGDLEMTYDDIFEVFVKPDPDFNVTQSITSNNTWEIYNVTTEYEQPPVPLPNLNNNDLCSTELPKPMHLFTEDDLLDL